VSRAVGLSKAGLEIDKAICAQAVLVRCSCDEKQISRQSREAEERRFKQSEFMTATLCGSMMTMQPKHSNPGHVMLSSKS
jgi:hypothetical protein